MIGKFEGESYINNSFDNKQELDNFIRNNEINFVAMKNIKVLLKVRKKSKFYTLKYIS